MFKSSVIVTSALLFVSTVSYATEASHEAVTDQVIEEQNAALAAATKGAGFGPQSPRDISRSSGQNKRAFASSPERQAMNLCNIHFHENAEHRGGEFTTYAGNGDGHGYGTGYKYNGMLTKAELTPVNATVGKSEHGDLVPGDTVEVHFVHSSADVKPGATLAACVTEAIKNPQLRVETVVAVLVNNPKAASMTKLAEIKQINGLYQAPNIPEGLGKPVAYAGSTTGPSYNEVASPFQVTWNVRPKVIKLDINSVAAWLSDNPFKEDHAHGVRNLVINPELLSPIQ